jgi:hypothetical protein
VPSPTLRVVLDTCILKLATFPAENNASALIYTVNTAPGHFDRKQYQAVNVARPGEFLNAPEVGRLVKKLIRE